MLLCIFKTPSKSADPAPKPAISAGGGNWLVRTKSPAAACWSGKAKFDDWLGTGRDEAMMLTNKNNKFI